MPKPPQKTSRITVDVLHGALRADEPLASRTFDAAAPTKAQLKAFVQETLAEYDGLPPGPLTILPFAPPKKSIPEVYYALLKGDSLLMFCLRIKCAPAP